MTRVGRSVYRCQQRDEVRYQFSFSIISKFIYTICIRFPFQQFHQNKKLVKHGRQWSGEDDSSIITDHQCWCVRRRRETKLFPRRDRNLLRQTHPLVKLLWTHSHVSVFRMDILAIFFTSLFRLRKNCMHASNSCIFMFSIKITHLCSNSTWQYQCPRNFLKLVRVLLGGR